MSNPTPTIEEYLKAIAMLEAESGIARPTSIAANMGVKGPTVSVTLRRLADAGLVERTPDGGVLLTTTGRDVATGVLRQHDIAQQFLEETLGLPHEEASKEACRLEHALSPRVAEALWTLVSEKRAS